MTATIQKKKENQLYVLIEGEGSSSSNNNHLAFVMACWVINEEIRSNSGSNLYWHYGRANKKWDHNNVPLDEVNELMKDPVRFFLSWNNNTGGADWKYNQIAVQAILDNDSGVCAYYSDDFMNYLSSIGCKRTFTAFPPFQDIEEQYITEIILDGAGGFALNYIDA